MPPSAEQLKQWDRAHVWHPFTQMSEWTDPLVIGRAEGNYLFDTAGRKYFDGVSSLWVTVHGHKHPALNKAIIQQLDKVAHSTLLGLANEPSIELARMLAQVAPEGLTRVFYSDSGSTAVEIALKQAFQYWQHRGEPRTQFEFLADAYHGDTLGAVGVGGISLFHEVFGPLLRPVEPAMRLPTPASLRGLGRQRRPWPDCTTQALAQARELFGARGDDIAALIVEPMVQGAAGMLTQPPGYLRGLADLCAEHGILLIADEVATGLGRTGRMFACEHEDVKPDFLCMAKGLSGGYLPLAATLTTDRVFEAFLAPRAAAKTFFHGHTYTGNPLACAAGVANLELFRREQVLTQLPSRIDCLRRALETLEGNPHVGEIRQQGLMVGVEVVADEDWTPYPSDRFAGARVCEAVRDHGVILRPLGDVIVMMPPLSSSFEELRLMVQAVDKALPRAVS